MDGDLAAPLPSREGVHRVYNRDHFADPVYSVSSRSVLPRSERPDTAAHVALSEGGPDRELLRGSEAVPHTPSSVVHYGRIVAEPWALRVLSWIDGRRTWLEASLGPFYASLAAAGFGIICIAIYSWAWYAVLELLLRVWIYLAAGGVVIGVVLVFAPSVRQRIMLTLVAIAGHVFVFYRAHGKSIQYVGWALVVAIVPPPVCEFAERMLQQNLHEDTTSGLQSPITPYSGPPLTSLLSPDISLDDTDDQMVEHRPMPAVAGAVQSHKATSVHYQGSASGGAVFGTGSRRSEASVGSRSHLPPPNPFQEDATYPTPRARAQRGDIQARDESDTLSAGSRSQQPRRRGGVRGLFQRLFRGGKSTKPETEDGDRSKRMDGSRTSTVAAPVSASIGYQATGPTARSRPSDAAARILRATEPGHVGADDWLQAEPTMSTSARAGGRGAAVDSGSVSRRRSRPPPRAHSAEAPWGGHYEARDESPSASTTPVLPPAGSVTVGGGGIARQLDFVPTTRSSRDSRRYQESHSRWDGTDSQYEDEYDAALAGATGVQAHVDDHIGRHGRYDAQPPQQFDSPRRQTRAAWGGGGVMDTVGTFGFDGDDDGDDDDWH